MAAEKLKSQQLEDYKMNLKDLISKLQSLEEGTITSAPPMAPTKDDKPLAGAGAGDEGVEECGPIGMVGSAKQPDNVTMNVSMNGTGAGGIKDLIGILRNIEKGDEPMPVHGKDRLFGDGYENSPEGGSEPEVYGIDAITQTGDDLASKGKEAPKVNGGGNPMQEALVSRLAEMYNEIKEGEKKTMSRAAKGVMKYGKDGMQALAKAGKEGKDLDKVRDKYNKYED